MPALVLTQDTITVRLQQRHLQLIQRGESGIANDFARTRVPLFDIERVVVIGRPDFSTAVLQAFLKNGIPVFFLNSKGRWLGSLSPDKNMNAARRVRQYQLANNRDFCIETAKKIIYAKIRNSRRVLQRLSANREQSALKEQTDISEQLKILMNKSMSASSPDELRGYEGMAAASYFKRLSAFFPENVPFRERSRRPPKDAANALLSWTYTIVLGEMDGMVRASGLDACIGFFHSISHGTPSLSLDLMEAFRAPLCDMLVLHLLNHNILTDESFEFNSEDGGTYLRQDARKDFFFSYENTMTRKFTPEKGAPHTDFRKEMQNSIHQILRAMEGRKNFEFFLMP